MYDSNMHGERIKIEMESVYCAVKTDALYKIDTSVVQSLSAKLRKASISFVKSLLSSVRMEKTRLPLEEFP